MNRRGFVSALAALPLVPAIASKGEGDLRYAAAVSTGGAEFLRVTIDGRDTRLAVEALAGDDGWAFEYDIRPDGNWDRDDSEIGGSRMRTRHGRVVIRFTDDAPDWWRREAIRKWGAA